MKTNTMKRAGIALVLLLMGLCATVAKAQGVPGLISYQGVITSGGEAFDGTGYFKFAMVNAGGDTTYWSNDGTSFGGGEPMDGVERVVDAGVFMVLLGDSSITNMWEDMGSYVFVGRDDAHLRIWFSEDNVTFTLLSPDQPVASTPYAMIADRVPFGAIGESQIANGAVTVNKIENGAVTANKLAADSVTASSVQNGTITSNKIDWTTMPEMGGGSAWAGYAENGSFAVAPVASGTDAIALGLGAVASEAYAVVGGGENNAASGLAATVGGGYTNRAGGNYATVGGGWLNHVDGHFGAVGGGARNLATHWYSAVGGGLENKASGDYATVGGGHTNTASGQSATVSGGRKNHLSADYATIGGGLENQSSAWGSLIAGGVRNEITTRATNSVIGGGLGNRILGDGSAYSRIGGGQSNRVDSSSFSVINGGRYNQISGGPGSSYVTISGGYSNTVDFLGVYGAIPGGAHNKVGGVYSFAAGHRAKAIQNGSFVWGDSSNADVVAVWPNSVTFRAAGGYRLFSDATMSTGVEIYPFDTAWSSLSDREAKENFEIIDTAEILEQLLSLPLTAWNYRADPNQRRYIGPVAQDFHAAFCLGNDTTINTLDTDGVVMAAIQALNQKLEAENAALRARLERLEVLMGSLAQ